LEVSFPTDADGYLSQECPSCEQPFKVIFGEGSEAPISCCPYCGYKGQDCWHTQAQVDYLQSIATSVFVAPELKKLERELKRSSGGLLKIDIKSDLPEPGRAPIETDDPLTVMFFPCCNESVKVERHEHHFCVICGQEFDMKTTEAKKVFLSHKGVDKGMVNDFKETLKLVGYDPWIDEDAMPAGTPLERGILQGMKDSCGAVFFITPSFKDEGYLQTEINYAIQEKRDKGERFAIVTLQFDENGKLGEIPDLLRPFVWKKPKTHLEAFREILRALPIAPGAVDWREHVVGVVKTLKQKSTTTELSDEGKAIQLAAVGGDGHVTHSRYMGGESLQAGGKSMISDTSRREVARWVGGLEDLQRRRFIRDLGHKGEVFEVTREGYEAAESLNPPSQ
jgi:hypothetical protein